MTPRDPGPLADLLTRRSILQRSAGAGGAVMLGGSLSAFLASCGGDDGGDASSSLITASADEIKNATGRIDVLGFQFYQDDKVHNAGKVKAKWAYTQDQANIPAKVKPDGAFDVADVTPGILLQMLEIDRLAPIDTEALSNYADLSPVLTETPTLMKSGSSDVYAVPFTAVAAQTAWDSKQVPEPRAMEDLLKPVYKGKVGFVDSAIAPIVIAYGLGLSGDEPQQFGARELDQVKQFMEELKPQIKTVYAVGDEINLMTRGDIAVATQTIKSFFSDSPNVKFNDVGATTFIDAWGVMPGAEPAPALQWLDQFISVDGLRAVSKLAFSLPANPAAQDVLPANLQISLEDTVAGAPILGQLPTKGDDKQVGNEELLQVWSDFKASFV
jgi:spermidine/putrescine-binding protein